MVANDSNLGFAVGNNTAAKYARGDHLLLLNPDTLVTPKALSNLIAFAVERQCAACGGVTYDAHGHLEPSCSQRMPSLLYHFSRSLGLSSLMGHRKVPADNEIIEVEVLSGAFMAVRADLWRELAGFDPSFIMYSEEVDLCKRIRDRGHKIYQVGNSRITHLVGSGSAKSPRRVLYLTRGLMQFAGKHFSPLKRAAYFIAIWLHAATRVFVGALLWAFRVPNGKQLVSAYAPIAISPQKWYRGWNGNAFN